MHNDNSRSSSGRRLITAVVPSPAATAASESAIFFTSGTCGGGTVFTAVKLSELSVSESDNSESNGWAFVNNLENRSLEYGPGKMSRPI